MKRNGPKHDEDNTPSPLKKEWHEDSEEKRKHYLSFDLAHCCQGFGVRLGILTIEGHLDSYKEA